MKKPRAFKRDAYIGIRLPDEDKKRLLEISRKCRRDASCFGREFIADGIKRVEKELQLSVAH